MNKINITCKNEWITVIYTERNFCPGRGTKGQIIPLNPRIWYGVRVHQGSGLARQ
jgi:hypothetical protein